MTAFRDGWVCPRCYTPNRAGDRRCYSCRHDPWVKPRGTGAAAAGPLASTPQGWARPSGRGSEQERVIPTVVKVLIVPIGVIYVIHGVLSMVGGVFYTGLALLSVLTLDGLFMIVAYAAAVITMGFGWLEYQLGKKILAGRRWAWLIGLALQVPALILFFTMDLWFPRELAGELPAWRWWVAAPTIYCAVVLALAILSDLVIRALLRRRERSIELAGTAAPQSG